MKKEVYELKQGGIYIIEYNMSAFTKNDIYKLQEELANRGVLAHFIPNATSIAGLHPIKSLPRRWWSRIPN